MQDLLHGYYQQLGGLDPDASAPSPPPGPVNGEYQAQGKIVRVRRFSRRLVFVDVRMGQCKLGGEDTQEEAPLSSCSCGKVEAVLAAAQCADLPSLHRGLKLGDEVRVHGSVLQLKAPAPAPRTLLEVSRADILAKASVSGLGNAVEEWHAPRVERAEARSDSSKVAKTSTNETGLCKFWVNTGRCERGGEEGCPYRHPTGADLIRERKVWVAQRVESRMRSQQRADDPFEPGRKKRKSGRALIFAQWIHTTFGKPDHAIYRVLDVAGGKGAVGLELEHSFNLPSTLIDPRERILPKWTLRNLGDKELNAHWKGWFVDPPCEELDGLLQGTTPPSHTLLIGLHPDQATEAIVDIGLRLGMPWAIVPCCVFPSLFPERRSPTDGEEVTTTERFIDYLQAKDPGIQHAYLPFEGRNRVLYWMPPGADQSKAEGDAFS
ncbi:hypothetical protein BJ684DRAFT_21590 [Piptocephalis cylindrospora]|uniref:C3H1-type domain-containing protein n=1 Tax=Piptocephalis cylindrospora TaxID=1907219 RepID=A0A4P9XZC2_9FUNG|nr:hypothetical protein BJ684DRAFT_21590 [Piptocephalis cylindrospora]|eukprot:RKP11836.1 hypothetical protein BJ684DRAFT_21590 [Piptocephalis cylindrospora]